MTQDTRWGIIGGYDPQCGDQHDWGEDCGHGIIQCRRCGEVQFDEATTTALDDARRITAYDPQAEMIGMRSELRRLREVDVLAKELANYIESRMIDVGGATHFYCLVCDSGVGGRAVTRNDIIHDGDCLIARARKLGLLEQP